MQMKQTNSAIEKYSETRRRTEMRQTLSGVGEELQALQAEIRRKRFRESSEEWIERCVRENRPFLDAIIGFKGEINRTELKVMENLYNNTPSNMLHMKREYLTIAKNIIYHENMYHFNEVYGVVAFLCIKGITGSTLFISGNPQSGIYELTSTESGAKTRIMIRNRDTKKLFVKNLGRKASDFAMFVDRVPSL